MRACIAAKLPRRGVAEVVGAYFLVVTRKWAGEREIIEAILGGRMEVRSDMK